MERCWELSSVEPPKSPYVTAVRRPSLPQTVKTRTSAAGHPSFTLPPQFFPRQCLDDSADCYTSACFLNFICFCLKIIWKFHSLTPISSPVFLHSCICPEVDLELNWLCDNQWAHAPQLSPWATTSEAQVPQSPYTATKEATPMRSPHSQQLKKSPHSIEDPAQER